MDSDKRRRSGMEEESFTRFIRACGMHSPKEYDCRYDKLASHLLCQNGLDIKILCVVNIRTDHVPEATKPDINPAEKKVTRKYPLIDVVILGDPSINVKKKKTDI